MNNVDSKPETINLSDEALEKMARDVLKGMASKDCPKDIFQVGALLEQHIFEALKSVRDLAVQWPSELIIEPKPGIKRFMTKTVRIEHEGALAQELSTCTEQGQGVSLDILGMRLRAQIKTIEPISDDEVWEMAKKDSRLGEYSSWVRGTL